MVEKKFELIPSPDSAGLRMVQVIPKNPKEDAPEIDVDDLILDFWDREMGWSGGERQTTGWLNGKYVKVTISQNALGKTIVEVWEI